METPQPDLDLRDEAERKRFLASLPHRPGVYIMKGYRGAVLYVGKANDLHSRVNSYFRASGDDRYFISRLPRVLRHIEILIVATEREALLLENNLIKEMKPRYNVLLRDDKSYMSIRLDMKHPYPRFVRVRGTPKDDGATYFGPYHSARAVKSVTSFVNRHFRFRTCTDRKFASRKRPCLRYHIGLCDAPCVKEVSQSKYRHRVREAVMFINGEKERLVASLHKRMEEAAEELDFEQAAVIRDLIFALEKIAQPQSVVLSDHTPVDIMGYAKEGDQAAMVVLEMRGCNLSTHRQTMIETMDIPDEEFVESFLMQHYLALKQWPHKIITPFALPSAGTLERFFTEQAGHPVTLSAEAESHSKLMGLAHATARSKMTLMGELNVEEQLRTLSSKLRMRRLPKVMECYDISHLQGAWAVGSMVVFVNGEPQKNRYRLFNIKSGVGGDDYASLREVMERRLARRDEEGWALPDLIVVDGGKGQLNAITAVFDTMNVPFGTDEGVAIISLAKERDPDGPPDRFFLPGRKNAVVLTGSGRELYILARIRDEAHRFAIEGHRKKRLTKSLELSLTRVPTVGPALAARIIRFFGDMEAVKKASLEELSLVEGVGPKTAELIHSHLHPPPDQDNENVKKG